MKTEMKVLPNGNCEKVVSAIQHECRSEYYNWRCVEYGWKPGLVLEIEQGDSYEDGFAHEIEIKICPFCGYQPERLNETDHNGGDAKVICDSLNSENK